MVSFHSNQDYYTKDASALSTIGQLHTPISVEQQWLKVEEFIGRSCTAEERQRDTPLTFATVYQDPALCHKLIALGVDIEGIDSKGICALVHALSCEKVMQILLEAGANSQCTFNDIPIIFWAIKRGDLNICQLLIDHGADLNVTLKNGTTLLYVAMDSKQIPAAKFLLERCVYTEKQLNSAYLRAIVDNFHQGIKLLIEHGCVVNNVSSEGNTPLHFAALYESHRSIQLLVENGADLNRSNINGMTPLHIATQLCSSQSIQLLYDNGANPRVVDNDGWSPMLYLMQHNSELWRKHTCMHTEDGFLTQDLIQLRLLGHRFSLPGELYNSLGPQITYPALANILEKLNFSSWQQHSLSSSLRRAVNRSLSPCDYTRMVREGQLVVLEAGWIGHRISVVLFRDWLAKGNRGDGEYTTLRPGITIFKMHTTNSLETAISKLLLLARNTHATLDESNKKKWKKEDLEERSKESKKFFETGIDELLELKKEHFIAHKPQKRGTCGWVAGKMSLEAMLVLLHANAENEKDMVKASEAGTRVYKQIMAADRLEAIKAATHLEAEPLIKQIVSFEELYTGISFCCLKKSRLEVLKTILDKNPSLVNAQFFDTNFSYSLLSLAVRRNEPEVVDCLLKHGANVAFSDEHGFTSLHKICFSSIACAKSLLAYGAEIDSQALLGQTPLARAITVGNFEMVDFLLNHNANPNIVDCDGFTALHIACEVGCPAICQRLIAQQIDLNAVSNDGSTPLSIAKANDHTEIVELLLKAQLEQSGTNDLP